MQKGLLRAVRDDFLAGRLYLTKGQLLVADGVVPVASFFDQLLRGNTINNAEAFLEDARRSFSLAAKANGQDEVERYAALGQEFLTLAHRAATVDAGPPEESFWQTSLPSIRK